VLFGTFAMIAWLIFRSERRSKAASLPRGLWVDTMAGVHQAGSRTHIDPFVFGAASRFLTIQEAFSQGDEAKLRELLGPDMQQEIAAALAQEHKGPSTVGGVSHEVVDDSGDLVSIHYRAIDYSDGSPMNEVWHFVSLDGQWRLNGIEQV
jgi:predicted lipid-binding transport protein (Tim44 family)